jgi:hypothetical protein
MTLTRDRTSSLARAGNNSSFPSEDRYFDGKVLALDVAVIPETLPECLVLRFATKAGE